MSYSIFVCIAALQCLLYPVAKERFPVCVAVADAEHRYGSDPAEAVAQAWVESRWDPTAKSTAGAVGPLQVLPRYFVVQDVYDSILAGVFARTLWRGSRLKRLCRYLMGYRFKEKSCSYGRKIVRLRRCVLNQLNSSRPFCILLRE